MSVAYDSDVRVSVCTASDEMAERLLSMLRSWASAECVVLSAERTESVSFREDGGAQLLILDMDSAVLPEVMPQRPTNVGLIVISGDAGRVLRSYRWHPSAFLKPGFDMARLSNALAACEKYLQYGRLGLESPYRRRAFRLPLGRIRYIEAAAHYCMFNQGKASIRMRFSIDEVEKLLPSPPFIRCHRSYIVNLGLVTDMTYTAVKLRGEVSLPVGRTYSALLRMALQAWRGGA